VPEAYDECMGLPKYPRQTQADELGHVSTSDRNRSRENGWLRGIIDFIANLIPWR
jgi:hypothetical protein